MVEGAQEGQLGVSREDYLADIYRIQTSGQSVSTGEVAQRLGVSAASTSAMFKRLGQEGLVDYKSYGGVHLTPKGERAAAYIVRRHRLLERFLVDVLGIGWEKVDEYADRMEHGVPDEVLSAMERLLGEPDTCPHGYPIPDGGLVTLVAGELLETLDAGERAVVRRVDESDPELLRYLSDRGLIPGVQVEVLERNEVDGTRVLRVGSETMVIGQRIAQVLTVDRG